MLFVRYLALLLVLSVVATPTAAQQLLPVDTYITNIDNYSALALIQEFEADQPDGVPSAVISSTARRGESCIGAPVTCFSHPAGTRYYARAPPVLL